MKCTPFCCCAGTQAKKNHQYMIILAMVVGWGDVRKCRYNKELRCISDESFHEGQLGYITDSMGYHKVGNPTNEPSVTLHLYAPPFQQCRVWGSGNAHNPSHATSHNYSEYGLVITD